MGRLSDLGICIYSEWVIELLIRMNGWVDEWTMSNYFDLFLMLCSFNNVIYYYIFFIILSRAKAWGDRSVLLANASPFFNKQISQFFTLIARKIIQYLIHTLFLHSFALRSFMTPPGRWNEVFPKHFANFDILVTSPSYFA